MKDKSYYLKKGSDYFKMGKFDEALSYFNYALEFEPGNSVIHYNISVVQRICKHFSESYYHQIKALELNSEKPHYYAHMGLILQEMNKTEESVNYYVKAVETGTENINVYYNLSIALQNLGRYEEAYKYQAIALELISDNPEFYNNLGVINMLMKKFSEASLNFFKSLEINKNNPKYYNNLGLVYKFLGEYQKSSDIYKLCIDNFPEYADSHLGLAEIQLLFGDYENGLREYEWRFFVENSSIKKAGKWIYENQKPPFKKSDISTFEGKRIYVYSEQAFGDTIKYCRFLKMFKTENREIIFECQPGLKRLLENVEGFDLIEETGIISVSDYDVSVPLMSLPYILNLRLETIPNHVPYIFADKELINKWKPAVTAVNGLKTGFVWQTSSNSSFSNRSVPLKYFCELSKLNDVVFFSLQKEENAGEVLKNTPEDTKIIDLLSDNINDFADTAAIIQSLDLVISVDTSIAQLAGAMGKQVWVLIPLIPYWPWMLEREDCVWYPTMKIFRQEVYDNWDSVFEKVQKELIKFTELHKHN